MSTYEMTVIVTAMIAMALGIWALIGIAVETWRETRQ